MTSKIRLGLLFGDRAIREGRRVLLQTQTDFDIVFEGSDGLAAVDQLLGYNIDVVLIDNRVHNLSGLETITRFHRRHADGENALPGFILTAPFGSAEMELAAMRAGAIGTVTEEDSAEALIERVRLAGVDREQVDFAGVKKLLTDQGVEPGSNQRWLLRLTDLPENEQRILIAIGEGIDFGAISERTGLPVKRVNEGLEAIQRRLGLATRHQLLVALFESGVVGL